jgi:sensor histidine kinase YesM
MKIDWLVKLQYFLQTVAFCLAISAIQYAFQPERDYEIALVYSLSIGLFTWVAIDFGRHLFPSAQETGWPAGLSGLTLTVTGLVSGYVLGTLVSDHWFGWSSWDSQALPQLRLSLLISVLAGGSITYYFYTKNKSAYLQTQMSQAHQLANEARLKLLEAQLEPHMLFNTLANLRVLIATDPQRAQTMLDHMIAYLRATLSASRTPLQPLQAEFDRLRDYLELMAVRMGARLSYRLELPSTMALQPVPTLILQPLVENAIKHGLEPKVTGGSITVRASVAHGLVTLEVQDDGVGLAATKASVDGFGLAQVRERLSTTYGPQGTLNLIAGDACGTSVRVTFPC